MYALKTRNWHTSALHYKCLQTSQCIFKHTTAKRFVNLIGTRFVQVSDQSWRMFPKRSTKSRNVQKRQSVQNVMNLMFRDIQQTLLQKRFQNGFSTFCKTSMFSKCNRCDDLKPPTNVFLTKNVFKTSSVRFVNFKRFTGSCILNYICEVLPCTADFKAT